jgi:Spy/CpxP family protein refolding chaperone
MRGLSPDERQARLAEMQAARERLDETVADVLLPHQWDRLHQIQIHQLMRRQGTGGALANEALAETLGITPEQQQRLRAKQEKVAKDVQKRIAEIHREAREEVLSVLTPTQRKKLEEMLGEPFDTQVER